MTTMKQISTILGSVHQTVTEMKKFNKIGFVLIMLCWSGLLIMKALKMPVSNDETPTAVAYYHYTAWQIMMFPEQEPNNHILNTLIVKFFIGCFGNTQLIIRLPNLLAFLVYGFAVYRIVRRIPGENSPYFLPVVLLFVSNPYMLSFFALCRGYGISCALALLSASFLLEAYQNRKSWPAWMAFFLAMLASYAQFTLLVFLGATGLLTGVHFIQYKKWKAVLPLLVLLVFTVLYGALIANPIMKLQGADAFRFWTSQGFYRETIYPFIEYSRNGSRLILNPGSHLIAGFIFLTLLLNLLYVVRVWRQSGLVQAIRTPVFTVTALLLMTAAINILQCRILKTPNLHGRTAMFFYPLFIAAFAGMLGWFQQIRVKRLHGILAFAFAFICIFHMADRFSFTRVKDWWHDADTFVVLNYLKENHTTTPVVLKTQWMCHNSFYYYVYTGKVPWLELENYDKSVDPNTRAEFYYVFLEDTAKLQPVFKTVKFVGRDRVIMQKEHTP